MAASSVIHRRQHNDIPEPQPRSKSRCILDLWQSIGHEPACVDALGRALVARPQLVDELHDLPAAVEQLRSILTEMHAPRRRTASTRALWLAMTALILEQASRSTSAYTFSRRAMPDLVAACAGEPECLGVIERSLRERGMHDARLMRLLLRLRRESRESGNDLGGQQELRSMALASFVAGRFVTAEHIYRHLLAEDFEPAGTRTHLARVLIMTGRELEAARLVAEAWPLRAGDDFYIHGRILYLQALLATLAGADSQEPLGLLKGMIGQPNLVVDWTMSPVIRRVAPRLTPDQRTLFCALLAALSTGGGVEELKTIPTWQQLNPIVPMNSAVLTGGPEHA